MFSPKKLSSKSFLVLPLALLGLVSGIHKVTLAGGNPGLVIFSGIKREDILPYYLDFGVGPDKWERYRLSIPAKKMTSGASKFFITYPDYYDGKFDSEAIEVKVKNQSMPIEEVYWDKESRIIEIDLKEPIKASEKVEIVLSNVKNPKFGGTYYFHCQLMAAQDLPIRLHVGTWIVDINQND
jgi:Protein of unknown function (DUF2808)